MQQLNKVMSKAGSYQELRKHAEQGKRRDSENLNEEIPSNHAIWDVWASIKRAYPGGTVNWDADPSPEWAYALNGLSSEQISNGLKAMIQEGGKFPPSAPSFRELCGPNDWEQAASRISVKDAINAPILNLGENVNLLDTPEGMKAKEIGTPSTNPNYFQDLMK